MKTLTKITLPLILLFLSGCAHHGYYSGHYNVPSYAHSIDRHSSYQPHSVYYDRHTPVHNTTYIEHYDHGSHHYKPHKKQHHSYNHKLHKKQRHSYNHKLHKKQRYSYNHNSRSHKNKSQKSHDGLYGQNYDKHNNGNVHNDRQHKNKHKKRVQNKEGTHFANNSFPSYQNRHNKHSRKDGSHRIAKRDNRKWNSGKKRSRRYDNRD